MGMTHAASAADDDSEARRAATADLASTAMRYAGYVLTSDSSFGVNTCLQSSLEFFHLNAEALCS